MVKILAVLDIVSCSSVWPHCVAESDFELQILLRWLQSAGSIGFCHHLVYVVLGIGCNVVPIRQAL